MAEGARLESVYTFTGIVGSNPTLSAILDASGPECVAWKDTHSYQFQDNFCIRRLQASVFGICMGASKSYAGCWTLVSGS